MRMKRKSTFRLAAAALAMTQLFTAAASAAFTNGFSWSYPVGEGLTYTRTEGKNTAGVQRANVLTYEPNTGVSPVMVYAGDTVYGSKATIVMPTTTPLIKVNRTRGYGAEVVLHGDVYDEACAKAYELAEEHGYTFIHPFDDLTVATGQGTIAMEIFKELPLVDYILVPIGGGGLATGVSTLAKLLNPKIKVIGVEPAGANCMQVSLKNGKVTTLPKVNTIADGTAVKTPGSKIFPYLQKNLDDVITVEDEDLVVAFLDMVENHKMIVENSGLLTVAALKQLNVKDKRIVSILSGGNMDVITMSSVVQQGLILRDRIFTVSVLLPDKPGELCRVSGIIAGVNGNVIKLEHNQFVSINRSAAVELRITLEAFGTEHKNEIIVALEKEGYQPKVVRANI